MKGYHAVAELVYAKAASAIELKTRWIRGKPRWVLATHAIVESGVFKATIVLAILVNTVLLALDFHNMPESLVSFLETANVVLTIVFTVEMAMKLLAYGPRGYSRDTFNLFDGTIVTVSLLELIVFNGSAGGAVSILRTFRLLRVLKLANFLRPLRILLGTVFESLSHVSYMTALLGLFLFMFAVLGMQLFAGALVDLTPRPQFHFDNLWWAIVSVFQALTADDWNIMMQNTVEATTPLAIVYYVCLTLFGNYIVVSLFVAILLQQFAAQDRTKIESEDLLQEAVALQEEAVMKASQDVLDEEARNRPVTPSRSSKFLLRISPSRRRLAAPPTDHGSSDLAPAPAPAPAPALPPADDGAKGDKEEKQATNNVAAGAGAGSSASAESGTGSGSSRALGDGSVGGDVGTSIVGRVARSDADGGTAPSTPELGAAATPRSRALRRPRVPPPLPTSPSTRSLSLTPLLTPADIDADTRRAIIDQLVQTLVNNERTATEERHRKHKLRSQSNQVTCEGKAFGCLTPENRFRQALMRLCTSTTFEVVVIILIVLNCVSLALENPGIDEGSALNDALVITDALFTALFTIEMFIKMAALGVWGTPSAYLRNGWNRLDCFVVVVSIISLAFPSLSVARALRAMRPIRVVVRSDKIKVVLKALVSALPNIGNVMCLSVIFWLIFGILGVSLFKGQFNYCTDPAATGRADCVGTFTDPATGAVETAAWRRPDAHFDNVGAACLALFQVATLSSWTEVAYRAVAINGVDKQPVPENKPGLALYFIIFIVVCSFFTLNLFIGVVIDNFTRLRQEFDGSAFMTEEQRQWTNNQKLIAAVQPKVRLVKPRNVVRRACFVTVKHAWFDPVIMTAILLNTLTMMMQHYDMSDTFSAFLDVANLAFVGIFTLEAVLQITAVGFPTYWKDSWNRFDFVVVVASLVGLFVNAGVGANVVRVFRVGRVFRLIKRAKTLRALFETLVFSVPSLWNIGSLLFVLFFIFAVLGTAFFGSEPFTDDGFSAHANFRNFANSMLTLWRLATGDSWQVVMHASMRVSTFAALYYLFFMLFGGLVMVNLFIAVILENFSESTMSDERDAMLSRIAQWSAVWAVFDPSANQYIRADQFVPLLVRSDGWQGGGGGYGGGAGASGRVSVFCCVSLRSVVLADSRETSFWVWQSAATRGHAPVLQGAAVSAGAAGAVANCPPSQSVASPSQLFVGG